jgi:hypothetical protein
VRLQEVLDRATAQARDVKEQKVRDAQGDPDRTACTILNVVHAYRGEEPVALLMPTGEVSGDTILRAAHVAALGFGADVLAVTSEGWMPTAGHQLINPRTGRQWQRGEMQEAVEEHGALESGTMTEVLTTVVVNRAGDVAGAAQTFRVRGRTTALGIAAWDLEWTDELPPEARGKSAGWGGRIPETLAEIMEEVPVDVLLARVSKLRAADYGLTEVQARAHMDCAVVKTLTRTGFEGAVLLQADSPERAAVIEASLGHLGERL